MVYTPVKSFDSERKTKMKRKFLKVLVGRDNELKMAKNNMDTVSF